MQNNYREFEELVFFDLWFADCGFWFLVIPDSGFLVLGLLFPTGNKGECLPYFSNNSQGRLFIFSHQKGASIRGRRLFQIFLARGRALCILFYYTKQ